MDYNQDRSNGVRLAQKLGAGKTATVIGNKNSSFEDIFGAAIGELGLDAVAAQLIQGPPVWAHMALLHIPDLGAHREALLKKAADAPDGSVSPGSGTKAAVEAVSARDSVLPAALMGGPLSKMRLNNHMAADCQWTAKWTDGGQEQPTTKYPDWNKWTWSGTLTAGCGSTMDVPTIQKKVPNSPINKGDVIWIYVWVAAGTDNSGSTGLKSYQFTYDPGTPYMAVFGISGTTTINTLSVEQYPV